MAFTSPFTAVTGANILASDWNTSGRDNINALWVYTAAGSISYSTSSSVLAELAKPSTGSLLHMTSAGVPSWARFQSAVASVGLFTTTSATAVDITGLSVTLTLPSSVATWTVIMWMSGSLNSSSNGTGDYVFGSIGGTDDGFNPYTSYATYTTMFGYVYVQTGIAAGSCIVKGRIKSGGAGVAVGVQLANLFALALPE